MATSKSSNIAVRLDRIDAQFDTKTGGYSFKIDFKRVVDGSLVKVKAEIYRELAAMPPCERDMLKIFEYFVAGGVLGYNKGLYEALIWGDSKAEILNIEYLFEASVGENVRDHKGAIDWVFARSAISTDSQINTFIGSVDRFAQKYPGTQLSRRAIARLRGGSACANANDLTDDFAPERQG